VKNWTKTLSIIAIVLSLAAITGIFNKSGGSSAPKEKSVLEHVRETGVLRCGYVVEPPYTQLDASGKPEGIIPDIMAAIAKYAEIKVEFTQEIVIATMLEDINQGKYDVSCGSWYYNPIRSKRALFTKPFAYSPVYTVVRADDNRLKPDLSNLESDQLIVASIDGEAPTLTSQVRYPKIKYFNLPQASQLADLLVAVADKKADVVFMTPEVFRLYDEHNPGKLKILSYDHPFMISPVAFMVKSDAQDLATFISDSIEFLDGLGVMDQIYDKYDPKHELFLRPAKTYQIEKQVK
jgi:ABC-type amino acid transport substrate-binding protein